MVVVWLGLLLVGLSTTVCAQSLEQRVIELEKALQKSQQERAVNVFWKDGIRFQTADKMLELRIGGRLQNDWVFFLPSDDLEAAFGDPEDRIFFRRARMSLSGTLYQRVNFKLGIDFAGGEVAFNNTYVQLNDLPVAGDVTVGLFKEPFGLEELTSSRFITFQERSLTDAFPPGRNIGVMLANTLLDKRMTWALAVTRVVENDRTLEVAGSGGDYNVTLRLTGLPWYTAKGQRLAHLGFAYSYRNAPENAVRHRTRPEARLDSLRFVDTGDLNAKTEQRFGVEGALVYGPFSLQCEWMMALPNTEEPGLDDPTFKAFYVMGSFFLTGERRPYDRKDATFGRPRPQRNFDLKGGLGAWEIAVRLSYITLDEAFAFDNSRGGEELNATFGVNWYLNPQTRFTWNYVLAKVDRLIRDSDDDGNVVVFNVQNEIASIFMIRFQVDF